VKTLVFLGAGRITSALVAGLRCAGYSRPIVVHDRHIAKMRELRRKYGVIAESNLARAVESANLLVIAVRPNSVRGLLNEIQVQDIRGRLTAVSLAAGIPLSTLRKGLPAVQWVRAMPSPVCRIAQGLTAISFGRGLSSTKRGEVRRFFALVGDVVEIPEKQFDAFTVTFSSSHGYHALATLIRAAETNGLDPKIAHLAAVHALADGIASWRSGKLSLDKLLEEAATPGGTAQAVMDSLDRAGYQRMVTNALRAGIRRARRNA
jgi:pyrroline-5-carboxylate reductase